MTLDHNLETNRKVPIWIDCDPGQDDIIAIALAAYNENFNLLGISTVHGNTSLKNTTNNTLRFLAAISKIDIPVFPGSSLPLSDANVESIINSIISCPEVHGKTGLNGSKLLPAPRFKAKDPAEFFPYLKKLIEQYKGELNLAAIGPLTNIALFFRKYPELKKKIKFLTIMGGGFKRFNKNGNTEFNIIADPIAANEILGDPNLSDRIILAPLDVTHIPIANQQRRSLILNSPSVEAASNFRALMFELIQYFYDRIKLRRGPDYQGPSVHDPVAVAALLQMNDTGIDLGFTFVRRNLRVLVGGEQDGVVEVLDEGTDGVIVLQDINSEKFWDLILNAYNRIDEIAYINTVNRDDLINECNNFENLLNI